MKINQVKMSEAQSHGDPAVSSCTFISRWVGFLFTLHMVKTRRRKAQTPARVPTLCCSSSYLLSSEQLAGNISPTSGAKHFSLGGTEHLRSSMLIWLCSVIHRVHQFSWEACLFCLHTTTSPILLINLHMWHLSHKKAAVLIKACFHQHR